MTICFFGIYDANYNRNKILIRGLRANGINIIECNSRLRGFGKYYDLIKKHNIMRGKYDAMIVGFPGYQAMILARFLTRKPIFFDAFFSFYDAMVLDRQTISRFSPKAIYYWLLDYVSCSFSDRILLDTNEHIKYFVDIFKLNSKKFIRVFIGADIAIYHPEFSKQKNNNFVVHFHGSFIRSQGIDFILEAADKLRNENIIFNIVGKGLGFERIKNMVEEMQLEHKFFLHGYLPQKDLIASIKEADICLGIFGNSARTARIIPNKIFECIAMKKTLLTADTPAVRELFDEKTIAFCSVANSQELANAILFLKNNPDKAELLAENAYNFFMANLQPADLTFELSKIIGMLAVNNKNINNVLGKK